MRNDDEGHGILHLPRPPFFGMTFGRPAPVVEPPPPVDTALPAKMAGLDRARALADAVIAQLDPAMARAAGDAAAASQAAQATLRQAQQELASLPAEDGLPIDQAETVIVRRLALQRMLPGFEARARAADAALGLAIAEARSRLDQIAEHPGGAVRIARATLFDIDEQISALQRERADVEIAIGDAKSMLRSWGSESFYPLAGS